MALPLPVCGRTISKDTRCCFNIGCLSETRLKIKSRNILFAHNIITQSFWNFAQSMAVSLPCSVQNLKVIWQRIWMISMNKISQDLSLGWVLEGYHISPQHPEDMEYLGGVSLKNTKTQKYQSSNNLCFSSLIQRNAFENTPVGFTHITPRNPRGFYEELMNDKKEVKPQLKCVLQQEYVGGTASNFTWVNYSEYGFTHGGLDKCLAFCWLPFQVCFLTAFSNAFSCK